MNDNKIRLEYNDLCALALSTYETKSRIARANGITYAEVTESLSRTEFGMVEEVSEYDEQEEKYRWEMDNYNDLSGIDEMGCNTYHTWLAED